MIDPSLQPIWLTGDSSMENVTTLADLSSFFTCCGFPHLLYAIDGINIYDHLTTTESIVLSLFVRFLCNRYCRSYTRLHARTHLFL